MELPSSPLLCLFAVPLAILAQLAAQRRRRRYPVRFPALATLAAVVAPEPQWRRHLPLALFALALAALAISLAKPERTVQIPVERASVVLVTDVSRSMSATDVSPTRLEAARQAALTFLDKVPKAAARRPRQRTRTPPQTLQTPTTNHDAVSAALESLQPISGTATGAGLRTALDDLKVGSDTSAQRPPAALVLLSDGSATDGAAADIVAAEAKRLHVPIYTVALGTDERHDRDQRPAAQGPARSRGAAADRGGVRRPGVPRLGCRPARRGLRQARLADRHEARQA